MTLTTTAKAAGWNVLTVKAPLLPGFNTIDVDGAAYVTGRGLPAAGW